MHEQVLKSLSLSNGSIHIECIMRIRGFQKPFPILVNIINRIIISVCAKIRVLHDDKNSIEVKEMMIRNRMAFPLLLVQHTGSLNRASFWPVDFPALLKAFTVILNFHQTSYNMIPIISFPNSFSLPYCIPKTGHAGAFESLIE